MPMWLQAGLWGTLAGAALLLGAAAGWLAPVPRRVIAGIMAFGGGVLISALAFDLMNEAYEKGGFVAAAAGFLAGAALYSGANWALARRGAKHRKRSGHHRENRQPNEGEAPGSGMAIAVGALLDGIPESIAIGASLIDGGAVSTAAVVAVFLSNLPEGLSSSAGMKRAGRGARYVFGVWGGIAAVSGVASVVGYSVFRHLSATTISATIAFAAGAILAMLSDTMMPEAYEDAHGMTGLLTVLGFLVAFLLTKLG